MSVYQNINGTLTRMDASDLVQLAATDTEGILGGTPGATTNGQTLVDQLAADDVQAQTDIGQIKTDLSDLEDDMSEYHVVPSKNLCPFDPYLGTLGSVVPTTENGTTLVLNGVASGNFWFGIATPDSPNVAGSGAQGWQNCKKFLLKAGSYVLACTQPMSEFSSNHYVSLMKADGASIAYYASGHNEFTLSEDTYLFLGVRVANGETYTNKKITAYIKTAADYAADPSYEPNWETLKDSVAELKAAPNWNSANAISNNTDLNNLKDGKRHFCQSGSTASTLAHCPISVAFILDVIIFNSDASAFLQILQPIDGDKMFKRNYASGAWGSWYKFTGTAV